MNEEGGSKEESISEFITKNNDSLPRAHTTMLKHHLEKMCERGEIVMTDGGRFCFLVTVKIRMQREKKRAR